MAFYFRGDVETALIRGARALAINPNDTELLREYGFRLALSGEWDRGCGLITEAVVRNPGQDGYFEASLALCAYMQRDFATAEKWATLGRPPIKSDLSHHLHRYPGKTRQEG